MGYSGRGDSPRLDGHGRETPDVECVHADVSGSRFLIQQPGADEESTDGKEELHAYFAKAGERLKGWSENANLRLYL
jgi:hypothetical protein